VGGYYWTKSLGVKVLDDFLIIPNSRAVQVEKSNRKKQLQ
jgi:hypothetical protein